MGRVGWYRDISAVERRTFWACFGGWALDAFDVQLFAVVIPTLIAAFGLSNTEAGLIGGVTLVTGAIGGWVGGALADRFGRVPALQATILWFSIATFLSAFAQTFPQLLVLKGLQGLGFGAEWAVGAVLMGETIRPEHRGKALASVQSAWAVGWGASVLLFTLVFSILPQEIAWRALFAAGLLPALLVVYVRRGIPEPPARAAAATPRPAFRGTLSGIFAPGVLRSTVIGGLIGAGAHGGYYALTTWLPTYLRTERGLSVPGTGAYLGVIIVAFWCGCLAAALVLDRLGRRGTVVGFAAGSVMTVVAYTLLPLTDTQLLVLGFPLGFFAAGIPASLGALFSELYPGGVRGTGVGFCYNVGRIAAAAFPVIVGRLSESVSLATAIGIDAALAYALVVVAVLLLPETKGRRLDGDPGETSLHPSTTTREVAQCPADANSRRGCLHP